ncbi:MAG: O-antigen ligase family protein [Anaerolineae bacterium]|nr:O-antigen ligase family protein [Anaerolineae bacterium]
MSHFRDTYRIEALVPRILIPGAVLVLAFGLGLRASPRWPALIAVALVGIVLLERPVLGLPGIVAAALLARVDIATGTAVLLNPAALAVPAVMGVWMLQMISGERPESAVSPTNRPLFLFLLANLVALLVGIAFWDPAVPRSGEFVVVQLAQWALFVFLAVAYWLTGNMIRDEASLRRLTFFYLAVAGAIIIPFTYCQFFFTSSAISKWINRTVTFALHRAPFWMLVSAVAGGQLLFNDRLSNRWRNFMLLTLVGVGIYTLDLMRVTASNWAGVAAVAGVLLWLRFPRWRWIVILMLGVLVATGALSSAVYDFAGGDMEWERSGGSRLVLIGRVLEVTMRNPITGLGPAAYRLYAPLKPLLYEGAFWITPVISSHNNYVDLFSHAGVVGVALFAWFCVEVARLGLRVRTRVRSGFAAGYVNGMLAAGAGSLTLMFFADWMLPFVYNVGFSGFQAAVLVWLFLGGMIALERMENDRVEPV